MLTNISAVYQVHGKTFAGLLRPTSDSQLKTNFIVCYSIVIIIVINLLWNISDESLKLKL